MSWIAASLFAVVLIAPSFAFARGAKGHQIVAYIAEAHLTEATRQRIKAILPTNGTLGLRLRSGLMR